MKKFIITLISALCFMNINAQTPDSTDSNFRFNVHADLLSRYIWRGMPLSLNPNIQPYANIGYKGFNLMAFGSYAVSKPYAEFDLFLSYTKGMFTIQVNDYFVEDEDNPANTNYFMYKPDSTPHTVEAQISFNGPITLTVATFIYGYDPNEAGENSYSTYLEVGYPFTLKDYSLKAFVGGTVNEGFYADKAAITNVGFMAIKEIQITDKYSLPIQSSLIVNPNTRDLYFVFGITF